MDISILSGLFKKTFHSKEISVHELPLSGSSRRYFRLHNSDYSSIGVFNPDVRENKAFLSFSDHFRQKGLSVPEVFVTSDDQQYYLTEDLGDITLKIYSDKIRLDSAEIPDELITLYKTALRELVKFQIIGHKGLDYTFCVPSEKFNRQAMLWDLNHFKYLFLKLSGIRFDEKKLEKDFQALTEYLSSAETDSFMYRDFQSRNIMMHNDKLIFIDYQGGRKGALQYDPASLLFEAKADLPAEVREELLDYYLDELNILRKTDRRIFRQFFYPFALLRILQTLGAYGLRGLIEKKAVFLQSIPLALKTLSQLLENVKLPVKLPELNRVARKLILEKKYSQTLTEEPGKMIVRIFSFSYKKSIPDDLSGNGGGFVFDCRGIHNPGRYEEYKELTGKDTDVQKFLVEKSEMSGFLSDVLSMINRHITSFKENNYRHIQISFGCTGGRHRSVYAAEKISEMLNNDTSLHVIKQHLEI